MGRLNNTLFLFVIIVIEGYIVLSSELLAMRQAIPFVGSGTDIFSIIIAAVLLPLAIAYQVGGNFKPTYFGSHFLTIRKKLIFNLIVAGAFLLPALSYFFMMFFFVGLEKIGIHNNIMKITIYCALFISPPVYLLGQTIPLVSNYFSKERLSQITGKMLFFSTIGSFLGAVFATLVLMSTIGVHHTVSINFILLSILVFMLSKKGEHTPLMVMICIMGVALIVNSAEAMKMLNIVKNNKYSTMMVMPDEDGITHLYINNNDSSMYSDKGKKHGYVEFAEKITIEAIPSSAPPKDILIIGAGGFTFGHNDEKNNFVYIDIDKDLKPISEKYLLKEKLKPNKIFHPLPARGYLAGTDEKFDVIFLDAYLGALTIPEHLVTREFFQEIKGHLKDKGIVIANFILSPNFNNLFSKNIDNTIRSVFPNISRHDTYGEYDVWTTSQIKSSNFMYIYKHHKITEKNMIYINKIDPDNN